MARWKWVVAGASVLVGGVVLAVLAYPFVGSGLGCEGIGFGCTPEREVDTLLVVSVYVVGATATLVVAWWRGRRGHGLRAAVVAGTAITMLATATTVWSQLPSYPAAPGSLSASGARWERVLTDGKAVAPSGTPLGDALRGLRRRAVTCRDAYGRSTGTSRLQWSNGSKTDWYEGSLDNSGQVTAAALGRWADRLRGRGVEVTVTDPGSDPGSDRRLGIGHVGLADQGRLYARASFYGGDLEITASTGCHRD